MKKWLFGSLILLGTTPFLLSYGASFYLKNYFTQNLDTQVELVQFNHGWFTSTASLKMTFSEPNAVVNTQNVIHHGPIIWKLLFKNPVQAFSLYQIETNFTVSTDHSLIDPDSQTGSASTQISYLGHTKPTIKHPGMELYWSGSRVFTDLPQIKSHIFNDGSITSSISMNQFELQDAYQNIYLTQFDLEIITQAHSSFPKSIQATVAQFSAEFNALQLQANDLTLNAEVIKADDSYQLLIQSTAKLFFLNQIESQQATLNLRIDNLSHELVNYLDQNSTELKFAIQNNQWLALMKYFSEVMKMAENQKPKLTITINGLHDNQPIDVLFSGQLVETNSVNLNPFSFFENILLNLTASIPTSLIQTSDQLQTIAFFESITKNGLMIEKDQFYYSNLSFENAKLKLAN